MTDDYLRLTDPKRCPSCGHKGQFRKNGFCGNCATRLFSSVGDFHQMEDQGLPPHYWTFTKEDGWKHRDHFIVHGARPNPRTIKLAKLPKDYGKRTTPSQVAGMGGKLTKAQRQKLL